MRLLGGLEGLEVARRMQARYSMEGELVALPPSPASATRRLAPRTLLMRSNGTGTPPRSSVSASIGR